MCACVCVCVCVSLRTHCDVLNLRYGGEDPALCVCVCVCVWICVYVCVRVCVCVCVFLCVFILCTRTLRVCKNGVRGCVLVRMRVRTRDDLYKKLQEKYRIGRPSTMCHRSIIVPQSAP